MGQAGRLGWIMGAIAALALAFLTLPIVMIFPLSVDPSSFLRFPPTGFSLKWYQAFLTNQDWLDATWVSVRVALGASVIATTLGTAAAIGLSREAVPGRAILSLALVTPMLLPAIVAAVAIYGIFTSLGLVGTQTGLVIAHAVLGLPFVVLNVQAALRGLPRGLEEASMSLGAHPVSTLLLVTLPLAWRGVAAGWVFSFVISFDEVVIAMFLSSPSMTTLPKKMLDGVFFELTPMLAAISALLVIFNVVLALAGLALSRGKHAVA
jgi:ABC-type spermidine/putrescine transport system permease subunit II